jgi:hypothetical protein
MSKTNPQAWTTKYGARRVRREAPTLQEAIIAAQGLSDDPDAQADIAASLMGLPVDQVRTELAKMPRTPNDAMTAVTFAGPASAPRMVLVERKTSRRVAAADRVDRSVLRSATGLPPRKISLSRRP